MVVKNSYNSHFAKNFSDLPQPLKCTPCHAVPCRAMPYCAMLTSGISKLDDRADIGQRHKLQVLELGRCFQGEPRGHPPLGHLHYNMHVTINTSHDGCHRLMHAQVHPPLTCMDMHATIKGHVHATCTLPLQTNNESLKLLGHLAQGSVIVNISTALLPFIGSLPILGAFQEEAEQHLFLILM